MPTPTYDLISTTTLGGTASEVVLGSIPQGYRDLVLITTRTTSVLTNVNWRVNGDSGNNYFSVYMLGIGSGSPLSSSGSSTNGLFIDKAQSDSTVSSNHIVHFLDYSATDKHKLVLSREDKADYGSSGTASRWANTAAITSISLSTVSGTINAGSTFALYGIVA